MSVLIVSEDEQAVRALCSALARSGQQASWARSAAEARERVTRQAPLIVLVDEELDDSGSLPAELRHRPWTRVRLLSENGRAQDSNAIIKPFDAGELAALLSSELEAARVDQQRVGLQRQLEHSERLAAIGRVAASMAHEINNPLAVISASLGFIAEIARRTGDDRLAECEADMAMAVERIGGFVSHINGFARRERSELRDSRVGAAVDGALRMVKPRAADRRVRVGVEGDLEVRVPHDPIRLSQALLNLLANAVDAAADGGGHVVLHVVDDAERVRVQVDDDGPGLPKALEAMVFEPFTTTKPEGHGTGLGLSITRQIVEDHHGVVTLSRLEQGGTRAEIVLEKLSPAAHRVLVVERDQAVCRALAADLRRAGFQVETAESPDAALAHAGGCSVVVAEVASLGASGTDLFEGLAKLHPGVGRVVVTNDPVASVTSAHARFGKPWDRDALVAAIRDLCAARV